MIFLKLLFLVAIVASLPVQLEGSAQLSNNLSKRSIWDSLLSVFNGPASTNPGNAPVSAGTATAPANTPVAAPVAATSAVSTGSSSGGWLANILGLFGSTQNTQNTQNIPTPATTAGSPLDTAQSAPAQSAPAQSAPTNWLPLSSSAGYTPSSPGNNQETPTTSRENPGFTGLVTVIGAGGDVSSGSSSSPSNSSPNGALDSQIKQMARYAEMSGGISYSPYTKGGSCKTASEVKADIQLLSGYKLIRLYSVDCSGIENVVAALSSSQKLYLGIWDINAVDTDLPSMKTQVLKGSRGWSAVHTVAIGNEVVNSGRGTVAQVANAVSKARTWFKKNAPEYTGYIVTVDTLAATMANRDMCSISDYLAVNCHPYFSGIEASTSGTWLKQQMDGLLKFCGTSLILITESGWPSHGNTEGLAVPSVANQLLAIKSLGSVVGDNVLMFTTFNDYWKDPGPWNVEQHWGIYGDPEY